MTDEMTLDMLFEKFIEEKTFLQNCTPNTIAYFRQCYKAYKSAVNEEMPTKQNLATVIIKWRKRSMSVGCCNTYAKGLNSFLGWLWKNEFVAENLKIAPLKQEKRIMRAFSDEELRKLLGYKAKTYTERRIKTLLITLADTGARIDEILTLKRDKVDFDNMVLFVFGKGRKERILPIGFEARKALYNFMKDNVHEYVFHTRRGRKLNYQNMYRDFQLLCEKVGVKPAGFHTIRRTYARNYLRQGGNLLYLKKTMGHSRISTTELYVEVEIDALKDAHLKTSILSRLK